ncbi:MAG TPA: hypothetical protein VJU01_05830 [Gaiellaceae bacterium]|nr:hypothetical protein [Gaiellaceae bacterium]
MSTDKLVEDYLDRLELELADFPSARRRELVQEISEHIAEARAALESESEADVRNLLDRMGDPADIAAEARGVPVASPSAQPHVARRSSAFDIAALILLLVGGVVLPIVGWLVGVVLLWISDSWTTNEKLFGTFVIPGGLLLPVYLSLAAGYTESCGGPVGGPVTCTGGPSPAMRAAGIVVVVALFVLPFVTTAFLARRRSSSLALA